MAKAKLNQLLQDEKDIDFDIPVDEIKTQDLKKQIRKNKQYRENEVRISFYENERYIFEQIATQATLATRAKDISKFVKYDKKTGETEEVKEFKEKNIIYKPIENDLVEGRAIYLPTQVEEYGSTKELADEIRDYFHKYFEVSPIFEKFLPYYALFTWVYDKFPFVPYIHFMGLTGTGKTTAAEVLASVCYKGIDAAGSITIASIFRLADQWGGTLLLDEFDLNNFGSESYRAALSFLKAGVSDKSLFRVEGEKKRSVTSYKVKSPKIFTSESPISDAGLQSRTIAIKMNKNTKVIPLYRLKDYQKQGQTLRNKLLKWRLDHLASINLEEVEFGFEELSKVDRRVQQVITPIYYLSDNKTKKEILEFVKEQERETKRQRRESLEGTIFQTIYDFYEKEGAQPPLRAIAQVMNDERETMGYKTKISERRIAEIVRKILGFEIERIGHDNISTIMLENDKEKYEELIDYYGLEVSSARVAHVASVATIEEAKEIFQ